MVTYKSWPRSINQQFNFQGSTGLIARFGHVERGREGEEGGRKGEEGSTVGERKQSADQFQSDSGSEASLLCCRDDGDGGLAGGGGERRRRKGAQLFPPRLFSVNIECVLVCTSTRIPLLADWSYSVHVFVCVCVRAQP